MRFMATIALSVLLALTIPGCAAGSDPKGNGSGTGGWVMPEEGKPHKGTYMAFGPSKSIWGRSGIVQEVQETLCNVATALADYENVYMLVRANEKSFAEKVCSDQVTLIESTFDDFWMRDTSCVFVNHEDGGQSCVDFNFNGWGDKQVHKEDAKVATFVAQDAGVKRVTTDLVLEGGALEVDGEGTAIITESAVLNDNRNPGWTKAQVEAELGTLLGITKVIWLPGIKGKDITDGHTDFYARFIKPGVIVASMDNDKLSYDYAVTRTHKAILEKATDAHGRKLKITYLVAPDWEKCRSDYRYNSDGTANKDYAAGYINFYVANGVVIMPQFGDEDADAAAKAALVELYPDRKVLQFNIDPIASGGGGIHCSTQQWPRRWDANVAKVEDILSVANAVEDAKAEGVPVLSAAMAAGTVAGVGVAASLVV